MRNTNMAYVAFLTGFVLIQLATHVEAADVGRITVANTSRAAIKLVITEYFDADGNSYAIPDPHNVWNLAPGQTGTLTVGGKTIEASRVRYLIETKDGVTRWSYRHVKNGVLRVSINNWMHREYRQLWQGKMLIDRGKASPRQLKFAYNGKSWEKLEEDPVHKVTMHDPLVEIRYDIHFIELLNPVTGKVYRIYNEFAVFEATPDSEWILLTYVGGWVRTSNYSAIQDNDTKAYGANEKEIEWQGVIFDNDGNAVGAVNRDPVTLADNSDTTARDRLNEFAKQMQQEQEAREQQEFFDKLTRDKLEKAERLEKERERQEREKKIQEYKVTFDRIANESERTQRNRRVMQDFTNANRSKGTANGTFSPQPKTQCNHFARELIESLVGESIPELHAGDGTANKIYDALSNAAMSPSTTGWHAIDSWQRDTSPTYKELDQRQQNAADSKNREHYTMKKWEMQFKAASRATERGRVVVAITKASNGSGHIAIVSPAPVTSPEMVPPKSWKVEMPYMTQAGDVNPRVVGGEDGVWSGGPISESFRKTDLATLKLYIFDKRHFNDLNVEPGSLKKP